LCNVGKARNLEGPSKSTGVIVAEIDFPTRGILQAALAAIGEVAYLASNGPEAIMLASRMRASLVILDIKLSELDGVRACARIRALPGYESTPIVMLTSNDTERLCVAASDAGARMFLHKPLREATLVRALVELLPMEPPQPADDERARTGGFAMGEPELVTSNTFISSNYCIFPESLKSSGVIVADDDPLIRSILKGRLESFDQQVFLAHNGSEAVELASRIQASLVILDIAMPKLNGLLACAQIRALPGYGSTPIVMLTFDDTPKAHAAAARAGATMFLVKPFGSAALMLALSRFLPIDDAARREIQDTAIRAAGGRAFTKMHS
jgi:DNA-binding response OmpR family regulator